MIRIVTFLWSDPAFRYAKLFKYGPDHVDKLARGLRRNLTIPYEFVLITDHDPKLFKEPDRIIPLWPDWRELGGCYVRLKAFSPEMATLIGPRFAWIDLDTVVTGNLDAIFSRTEPFIAWKDVSPRMPYCGSLIMMDAGAHPEVWTSFNGAGSILDARQLIGTDQAWISLCLGPNKPTLSKEDGIYSYRKDIMGEPEAVWCGKHWQLSGSPIDSPKTNLALTDNAALVMFHGHFDPSTAKAPWIKEHWI